MTFADVRRLVIDGTSTDRALSELRRILSADEEIEESRLGPGHLSVHDTRFMYEQRRQKALAAGIDPWGVDDLLRALNALPGQRKLEVFHFRTRDRKFSVYADPENRVVVGCVSVPRRRRST